MHTDDRAALFLSAEATLTAYANILRAHGFLTVMETVPSPESPTFVLDMIVGTDRLTARFCLTTMTPSVAVAARLTDGRGVVIRNWPSVALPAEAAAAGAALRARLEAAGEALIAIGRYLRDGLDQVKDEAESELVSSSLSARP